MYFLSECLSRQSGRCRSGSCCIRTTRHKGKGHCCYKAERKKLSSSFHNVSSSSSNTMLFHETTVRGVNISQNLIMYNVCLYSSLYEITCQYLIFPIFSSCVSLICCIFQFTSKTFCVIVSASSILVMFIFVSCAPDTNWV